MIFNAERDEFQCGMQRLVAGDCGVRRLVAGGYGVRRLVAVDCGVRRLVVAWLECESKQAATSRRTPKQGVKA